VNVFAAAALLVGLLFAQTPRSVVPFVPTNRAMVDAMLKLAEVSSRDVVYDLGCGDGRIVITAAKQFGARGVCIDIDPALIAGARANAKAEGVEHLITFRAEDFYTTELKNATVVTLYLLPSVNRSLMARLRSELKPGARVVSNSFDMGDAWPADRRVPIEDTAIFLWKIQ
jgi:cyclopropane fatty-acyl-phospholipid synthase-like methyltransferase